MRGLEVSFSITITIEIHCPRTATSLQRHRAEELLREKFEYNRGVVAQLFFDADEFWTKGHLFVHTKSEFMRIFTGD